ncbi:MAG: hypothetical protein ORN54_15315 [Cyclobacteriaceae bacterium]|nr:hypothetical protein [Cyclobacteriaceae bacterium]
MNTFDSSEYKVTFLLGAGASAKALPTVKSTSTTEGLYKRLKDFADNLEKDNPQILDSYKSFVSSMVADISWLADNSFKFGTPDTFAKFLYLQERKSLPRLKNALSFYFTVEQFINNKFDDRALIFLTTVMQRNNIFPTNIKILNWNYDSQIQLAADVFRQEKFHIGQGTVHSPPLVGYYPSLGHSFYTNNATDLEETAMVHLNGIAGYYFNEQLSTTLNLFLNQKPKDINEIIEKLLTDKQHKHTLLTFAWERDTEAANILRARIEMAKKVAAASDILVIIGYSFPFFNREIDKNIFDSLKESGKLKRIFYQDPYKTSDFLKNQFDLPDTIEIIHITEKDNYFVPNEL